MTNQSEAPSTGVLQGLLPPGAIGVETFGEAPDSELFPEEEAHVAQADEARRREFASVRWCARAGLARLGLPGLPIVPGEQRAPAWPIGIVGSLTHCTGYRAAAVARDDVLRGVGIDAEPDEPLPSEVLGLVSGPAERSRLRELARCHPALNADRLLFCAKEAVYKVWYPLTRRWLGFEAADITIDPSLGRFTARILAPGPVSVLTGRWAVHRGIMVVAICVAHSAVDHSR